jgi:methyl-accepting chemotaxis protein
MNDSISLKSIFTLGTKRKSKNLLLEPSLQLKLPIYLLTLSLVLAILTWIVLYKGFEGLYEFVMLQGDIGEQIGDIIQYQSRAVAVVIACLLVTYVVLTVGISIAYLHRLIGPTRAFRRHLNELRNANYASRLTLRKNDAFGEVARDLNELAKALEKKYHSGRSESV